MSPVSQKRSVSLQGHRTSIALEPEFWKIIDDAIKAQETSMAGFLIARDSERLEANYSGGLASYLRVWAVGYLRGQLKG